MAYSREFRRQVLASCDRGLGTQAVALKFEVSESWVRRIKQERRELGKLGPAETLRRIPKWVVESPRIQAAVQRKPDLTRSWAPKIWRNRPAYKRAFLLLYGRANTEAETLRRRRPN